jgi:diketogulonate reductase-like aldo/keto reductase
MTYATLNNGTTIPNLGLGVFRMTNDEAAYNVIKSALKSGYRHIDTAMIYDNEEVVGRAMNDSGIPREEIFLTTKLWNDDIRKDNTMAAFEASLERLNVDYVDLYLVHWPVKEKFASVWHEMEKIYITGRAKAIGVSNYLEHHLDELLKTATIVPAVNQIELHPYLSQEKLLGYLKEKGIVAEAWSPFCAQKNNLLDEPILKELAKKHKKTPAQIVLRWNVQREVVVIPKSANIERQKENLSIFDFELSSEDILKINSLNKDERVGSHPDTFTF